MAVPFNYSSRNLWNRKFTTILTAGGMALVTFVFSAVMMLAAGLEKTLVDTGSPENVIILRGAAETEVSSSIERDQADIIVAQPEVEHDSVGDPLAAKETLLLVTLPKRMTEIPTNVIVRGMGRHSMELRPQVKLVAGRSPRPGSNEVIAGKNIAESIKNSDLGNKLNLAMIGWNVVGIFDAGSAAFNSEVWADADQIMAAFRRNSFSAMVMKVPGKEKFIKLKKRLETDPRLSVQVKREIAFYKEQSEMMSKFIKLLGFAMTLFFSVGAILGAMVTMYAAVANRTREIGTLRAIGFGRQNIMLAFLSESIFLGFLGGLVGTLSSSALQLLTISTLNWETFSEIAFSFRLTPSIALKSMGFALIMGLVGGMSPAWRAASLKIVDSLR
ncbi:MAG: FtsX-like permease family protein [Deltaproteobacteria bacterium]|nr:FtsX-like permease family protein [Deltaproteobacteria bacterium]